MSPAAVVLEAGEVSAPASVWWGLASTVVLVGAHLGAPQLRRLSGRSEHVTASFAGGLAVAYVFLHLLPEVAHGNERFGEVLDDQIEATALIELGLFGVALGGFAAYYALERLAQWSAQRSGSDHDDAQESERSRVFAVHLGLVMIYNAVIAYTLPSNYRVSVWFAVLFTVAIGLHFMLSDRGLEDHYGDRFDRGPARLLLAGALLGGWALAALVAPTRTVVVSVLTAFLAGGILLNVFKEEIPSTRRSHLGWFIAGLVTYSVLLGIVTLFEDHERAGPGGHGSDGPEAHAVLVDILVDVATPDV